METADHRERFVKSFGEPSDEGRSRHRGRRALSAVALGALLAAGATLGAASSPAKAGVIASVNMSAACRTQYPTAWGASFWNTGPYGWYCYNYTSYPFPNDLGGIDVNRACHDQYPGWNLHAVLVANNLYGWRCES